MFSTDQLTAHRQSYEDQGYALIRGFYKPEDLKAYQDAYTRIASEKAGQTFTGMHDPALRDLYDRDQKIESDIYNAVRLLPEIKALASDVRIAQLLDELLPERDWKLFEKMIMRIDMPNWTKEIAHWHQDYFYVKGNLDIVTLWIPLQDVVHENGCLLVAPETHKLGIVSHEHIIGKRNTPSPELMEKLNAIEVPMQFGDILVFHTLLFHSGQLNSSENIRYSFQFRYTPAGLPTDAGMGAVLDMQRSAN
jgi:ectoine hydroxylase-related dioxygenase (phytanoyl-CoA dioxygenase family)